MTAEMAEKAKAEMEAQAKRSVSFNIVYHQSVLVFQNVLEQTFFF